MHRALAVACPTCGARAGDPCTVRGGPLIARSDHAARTIRLQVTNRERRVIR